MKLTIGKAKEIIENNDGNLDLRFRRDITALPDNLAADGDFMLNRCINLRSLPKILSVKGDLDLAQTWISELPADLKVFLETVSSRMKCLIWKDHQNI